MDHFWGTANINKFTCMCSREGKGKKSQERGWQDMTENCSDTAVRNLFSACAYISSNFIFQIAFIQLPTQHHYLVSSMHFIHMNKIKLQIFPHPPCKKSVPSLVSPVSQYMGTSLFCSCSGWKLVIQLSLMPHPPHW